MKSAAIRRLSEDDLAAFRQIRLESLRAAPSAFGSSEADWLAFADAQWRRRLTDDRIFAAFVDADPIGLIALIPERGAHKLHRGSLAMVYLREAWRGRGVATALLAEATTEARGLGIRHLDLLVAGENPAALKFYQRSGFRIVGRIPGGYRFAGREVDEIIMARRIDGGADSEA